MQGLATITRSNGGLFAIGNTYYVTCVVFARRSEAGFQLEAPCTFTDSEGDQWYGMASRRIGDTDAGGEVSHRIPGGTGKFAGVTGDCPHTTRYQPEQWLVVATACAWRGPAEAQGE